MNLFSSWVLSIVGISLIGVLADLIIPNNRMKNVVKTVVAIFTVLVIVRPINQLNFDKEISVFLNMEVDSNFVENYEKVKQQRLKEDIENNLVQIGYFGVEISFFAGENNSIYNVYVDLKGLVLKDEQLNINKYTNIMAVIKDFVNIKEEDIIFYE